MTVEGVGISSISRIKRLAWNTISSWQYLACQVAGEFNDLKLKGVELIELQATDACNASWVGQKTTQLSGNLHDIGNSFLVVFHVFENSSLSREVYVDFGLVTTVNKGSTKI